MRIDLLTAWGNSLGGKGKKAHYETKGMRVPLPVAEIVSAITKAYTERGVILEYQDVFGDDFYNSQEYKNAIAIATQEYIEAKSRERE